MTLTHFDERGAARMVDVGEKNVTRRVALAEGRVRMKPQTLELVLSGSAKKGDVLGVARLAGIMAAKKTPDLIPLCHIVALDSVTLDFTPEPETSSIHILAKAVTTGKTGVEMDALTAVSVAALTVYDMLKSADKDMVISDITLLEKTGGKSGHYIREGYESQI